MRKDYYINAKKLYKLQEFSFVLLYWVLASNLYVFMRYFGSQTNPESDVQQMFPLNSSVILGIIGGLFIGGIIGLLEIFVYPKVLKKMAFGASILSRTVIFFIVVLISIALVAFSVYTQIRSITSFEAVERVIHFYTTSSFVSLILYLLTVNSVMNFILQVNKRLGPGVIINMLTGKYYHPREEERIFMFVDLQSSSTIAEKIGHVNYSRLLQDCFRDLSDILMKYEASVYQFVGDEAVLTWTIKAGLKKSNCYYLFHELEEILTKKKTYYFSTYGHNPRFKAALHMGAVTVAEVGEVKSELAYHGDVLNTAARVQALCNLYNKKLLVTSVVAKELIQDQRLCVSLVDEVTLRGKEKKETIYEVFAT